MLFLVITPLACAHQVLKKKKKIIDPPLAYVIKGSNLKCIIHIKWNRYLKIVSAIFNLDKFITRETG